MEGGAASTWLCECRGWGAWGQGHAASLPGAWLRLLSLPLRDGKQRAALVRGAPWRTLSCSTRGTPKVRASPLGSRQGLQRRGPLCGLGQGSHSLWASPSSATKGPGHCTQSPLSLSCKAVAIRSRACLAGLGPSLPTPHILPQPPPGRTLLFPGAP